ncbi:hypothetical protein BKA64DRAFT_676239 [Cadophora sp. MPI-SDFR-AT-0126]|nr:hypothetical protein BKA64DRAFT_676239 [Leotiomycetes sp. MPI-SDFR-AT-0126]
MPLSLFLLPATPIRTRLPNNPCGMALRPFLCLSTKIRHNVIQIWRTALSSPYALVPSEVYQSYHTSYLFPPSAPAPAIYILPLLHQRTYTTYPQTTSSTQYATTHHPNYSSTLIHIQLPLHLTNSHSRILPTMPSALHAVLIHVQGRTRISI